MPFLDEAGCLTEDGARESYRYESAAHSAVEILFKGPEGRLPAGVHFLIRGGIQTPQLFERPPLGWRDGRINSRTPNSMTPRRHVAGCKADVARPLRPDIRAGQRA